MCAVPVLQVQSRIPVMIQSLFHLPWMMATGLLPIIMLNIIILFRMTSSI